MRLKLAFFGTVLMAAMFYYANMYLSPQEKTQIGSVNMVCKSILNSPFGVFNGELIRTCVRLSIEHDILSIRNYVYLIGFGLFAIGLVTGKRTTSPFYVPNWTMAPSLPTISSFQVSSAPRMVVICPVCMSRSPQNTKFCTECGSNISSGKQL